MWKATAAYKFFPTESSGIAPFFLMFGCEAAVKHTLLASESPKYVGTDDSMINIELMSKLYLVVVHKLNEARKARHGSKKKNSKTPEQLKVGDNVLVRDHTSKVFQPKYKDFCIVGLLGKNQVKVKDNHGHTTKVHHRDMKKIPMTEKICQLYKEEHIGKIRNGRNPIPDSKWDTTEEIETTVTTKKTQETSETNTTVHILPEAIVARVILILIFLETTIPYIQKSPKTAEK